LRENIFVSRQDAKAQRKPQSLLKSQNHPEYEKNFYSHLVWLWEYTLPFSGATGIWQVFMFWVHLRFKYY